MRSSLWLKKVRRMPVTTIAGGASGGENPPFFQENKKIEGRTLSCSYALMELQL
jgi:hypothetical protein